MTVHPLQHGLYMWLLRAFCCQAGKLFTGRKREAQPYTSAVYRLACIQVKRRAQRLLYLNAFTEKQVCCAA